MIHRTQAPKSLARSAFVTIGCLISFSLVLIPNEAKLFAQDDLQPEATVENPTELADRESELVSAPTKVDIEPSADDDQIANRLLQILQATEWFQNENVKVEEGVVYLTGDTQTDDHKKWAGQLAAKTQDVVAVVNRIQVAKKSIWDLSPAWKEVDALGREAVQSLPMFAIAATVLLLTWLISIPTTGWARALFSRRIKSELLANVAARAMAILIFLLGAYLALRISGLTQVAATLIGGTGLVGLIVGIAFREIAENFLASILISVQRPFALGDVIEVDSVNGCVQSVTIHGTLLMTMDGNHVQIPNSVVYKSTIRNLTANPNVRLQFEIGIGYDDSISVAQETIKGVLQKHSAVLDDPEPLVLVDALGSSTVNLVVYFWIDAIQHSKPKVRSSIIRQAKQAIQSAGISMPDEAREVIVPKAIPIRVLDDRKELQNKSSQVVISTEPEDSRPSSPPMEDTSESTSAEGGLDSEVATIEQQARSSRKMEDNTNLLAN